MTQYFLIEDGHLRTLRALAKRLHTEERMNGDEMRDAGHSLTAIADTCEQVALPDPPPKEPSSAP